MDDLKKQATKKIKLIENRINDYEKRHGFKALYDFLRKDLKELNAIFLR